MEGRIKGFLDNIEGDKIKGWAFDAVNFAPVTVYLEVNNQIVGSSKADGFRPGLKNEGLHPTGLCGFEFPCEDFFSKKDKLRIRVIAGDQKKNLANSPQFLEGPSLSKEKNGKKVFFMHIAKTAGTTVNKVLSSAFQGDRVITHIESIDWKNIPLTEKYDFISGHVRIKEVLNYHDLSDYLIVTVLREPYEQLISHLRWLKHVGSDMNSAFFKSHPQPIQAVCRRINKVDFSKPEELEKYISNFGKSENILFDNCQTRYFIKDFNTSKLSDNHYEEAFKCLDVFDLIGRNSDLDSLYSSLKVKNIRLGLEKNLTLNVNKKDFGLSSKRKKVKEILFPLIKFDTKLYSNINSTIL